MLAATCAVWAIARPSAHDQSDLHARSDPSAMVRPSVDWFLVRAVYGVG
jgi:hypothetical protein